MSENNELSQRELEILQLVATGASNKEIAQQLIISTNTVKVHLRNIFAKIGATSRTEAAMFAVQHGLVDGAPLGENADIAGIDHKSRSRPLVVWSLVVVVVLLGFAGLLAVTINQRSGAASVNPNIPTDLPRWDVKAAMPSARYGFATAEYENWIYAIAGETEDGTNGNVERYNPELDSWVILTEKPLPVADVSGDVIGGKIYLPGGRLHSGDVTDILEVYDTQLDRWEIKTPIPRPLSAYASIAYEGKLYVFGGWDGDQFVNTVYEYDPNEDSWIEKTPMPTARGYMAAVLIEDSIHILGGKNDQDIFAVHETYTPSLDNGSAQPWGYDVPLPAARHSFGAASVAGLIYIVGGKGELETESLTSLVLLSITREWQPFAMPMPGKNWSYSGLQFWGTEIFLFGGVIEKEPTSQNNSYQVILLTVLPIIQQ